MWRNDADPMTLKMSGICKTKAKGSAHKHCTLTGSYKGTS